MNNYSLQRFNVRLLRSVAILKRSFLRKYFVVVAQEDPLMLKNLKPNFEGLKINIVPDQWLAGHEGV